MNLMKLSSDDKVEYLIKPILKVLQEAGGQLERSEIKECIIELDDQIAEYSELENYERPARTKSRSQCKYYYPFETGSVYFLGKH